MELENNENFEKQREDLNTCTQLCTEESVVDFKVLLKYEFYLDDVERRKSVDRGVLCTVLREDVFYLIDTFMNVLRVSRFVTSSSICDENVQSLLIRVIKKTEQSRPDKHVILCQLLCAILRLCKNVISKEVINTIYMYLVKSIDRTQTYSPMLKWIMGTLGQFPVPRLQFLFYRFSKFAKDNKVELFFRDHTQQDYNKIVKQIEGEIKNGDRNIEELKIEDEAAFMSDNNRKDDATRDIDDYNYIDSDIDESTETIDPKNVSKQIEYKSIRFVQSVIEVMGSDMRIDDNVVLMAVWIGQLLDKYIDRLYWAQEKLFELIHPYMSLQVTSDYRSEILGNHCTFCIVLFNLFQLSKYNYYFMDLLNDEAFDYLIRVLSITRDKWTLLFALLCLQNMELNDKQIKFIKRNEKFVDFFLFCYSLTIEHAFKPSPYLSMNPLIDCQIHFVCHCLLNSNENSQIGNNKQAVLNSADKSAQLSTDLLSARCDFEWASARSVGHVSKGAYFFETLVLTNGAMRIGWSTKRHNLMQNKIGDDQHSIAYDGYNRCVWHRNERIDITGSIKSRWTAGDVIGCLIRVIKDHESDDSKVIKFTFYLNGRELKYNNKQIHSSVLPYHATVSLSTHQQCHFNFGQLAFKYPPKDIDYFDFTIMYDQTHQDVNQSQLNLSNAVVQSSLININSTNSMGDFTISKQQLKVTQTLTGNNLNNKRKINSQTGFITCKSCHKQMSTKRLKHDCCYHLEYSSNRSATKQNQLKTTSSLAETQTTTTLVSENVPCKLCDESKQTRALQFVNCGHMKLCRDCVPSILDCPKCPKQQL